MDLCSQMKGLQQKSWWSILFNTREHIKVFASFLWVALPHPLQVLESTCVSPSNLCMDCGPSQVSVHLICPKRWRDAHTCEEPATTSYKIPFGQVMENNEALLLECYQSWSCFVKDDVSEGSSEGRIWVYDLWVSQSRTPSFPPCCKHYQWYLPPHRHKGNNSIGSPGGCSASLWSIWDSVPFIFSPQRHSHSCYPAP